MLTPAATTRKKICLLTTSELVVRWFLLDQLAALSQRYDVTLLVNTDNPSFLQDTGIRVRVLPLDIARKISPSQDLRTLLDLVRRLQRERFDLVHTVAPKAGLLGIMAAAITRVPLRIHTFQGEVWATRTGLMRRLLRFLDWLVARLATHLLVVSESERQFLVAEGILPPSKSRVLAKGSICGVDTQRFSPPGDNKAALRARMDIAPAQTVFLYVGRLTKDKGILDLVVAFDQFWLTNPASLLMIVGPDEEQLGAHIRAMKLKADAAIRIPGPTTTPEDYIAAADVVCLPSYREGLGMVLIEAAAVGIPAMASRIYGISDAVVDGETGLLHTPASVEDIRQTMQRLSSDPALRQHLGDQALQRARRDFSQETVTAALLDFYTEILAT